MQQQCKVLANNLLDQPLELHGKVKHDLWKKSTWDQFKERYRLFVSTPAILDQCLMHSFLKMDEIALIVFDEAHHTKKDHPYSRIIRSYYLKCPHEERPRVFGMTASAVDSKGDIATTGKNLEEMLQAKIITTDDGSLLAFAPKPTDVKWYFPKLRTYLQQTDLHQKLSQKARWCNVLRQGFTFVDKAVVELGPWCADQAWKYIFRTSSNQSSSIVPKFERDKQYLELSNEDREEKLQDLHEAELLVNSYARPLPEMTANYLSSKVLRLCEELSNCYQNNPKTRAIIFIEERLKAHVLCDLFKESAMFGHKHIIPGVLLGMASQSFDGSSLKLQEQTLQNFQQGHVNLVFATSVADEGLDIPQCNLCVRFDLCKTTIQYMQSKGRARKAGSIFAHMLEEGHNMQEAEVQYYFDDEQYIKRWCGSLPHDRKLGQGTHLAKLLSKDAAGQEMKTDTGAVLDYSNSLTILARFTASLRHTGVDQKSDLIPVYDEEIDEENTLFRYKVRIPTNEDCQVSGCRGHWKSNKQLAKRAAAFGCCYILRQKGLLDENLDSIFRKLKPENLNARLAVTKKKDKYDMQIKPTIWQSDIDKIPTELFVTLIRFGPDRPLKHDLAPVVVFTKSPLPLMPSFYAYLENGIPVEVVSELFQKPLRISQEQLELLTTFTLNAVFLDVFNKTYAAEPHKMSYWLASLRSDSGSDIEKLEDLVDLSVLEAAKEENLKWEPGMEAELWTNRYIVDPYNGKFRYFTGGIASDISITDPVPDFVPNMAQKKRRNILDWSNSLWTKTKKKVEEAQVYDHSQPILHADLVGSKRNFLDQAASGKDLIPCLIAPQTLKVGRAPANFMASCLVWPAVIHRIEAYMITLEAFDRLDLPGVSAELALEAFTKDADNEEEEFQTHTGGKRGMGKNYERLEFIGDSLLKTTTTMTVFNRTSCDEEGMHCRRMEILCNRNLYNVSSSDDLQLYRHARTLGFDRATWYPEHLTLLHGRGAKKEPLPVQHEPMSQDLGMKTVADMSEAVIGAAITATKDLPANKGRFDLGVRAITKLVRSPDHDVDSWADIAAQYVAPDWALQTNDIIAIDRTKLVATKTGYTFKHPRLLRSAFTHSSDTNSPVPDLQRLEFLGDAVLDWVCISWLYNTNPTRNPQWLTEHKMAMVSNKFLAALAVTLDFDKFVFVTTAKLIADIQIYATKVREALSMPECPKNFWVDIESPPKALSDLVESYLGAVLVDSGFDYAEMENFFDRHVKHFFEDITAYDSFANRHPTTYLYRKLNDEYRCRDFTVMDIGDEGAANVNISSGVLIHQLVVCTSEGTSTRYARVRASKMALQILDGMSRDEFRRKYGCNCAAREGK